jgi:hypothetical protein
VSPTLRCLSLWGIGVTDTILESVLDNLPLLTALCVAAKNVFGFGDGISG